MTHFLQRTALIALATGALGACSTTDSDALRPSYPVRAPETPPPAANPAPAPAPAAAPTPPASDTPVTAAPAAPVEQRPLQPLAAPAAEAPRPPAAPPAPRPAPAPQPTFRTVTTRSVTGKVVEVEGPAVSYRVKKGDTLEEIADKLDTTVSQLRDDNGLRKRDKIHPGDTLKGPPRSAHAYVAGQGDTLYSIAKRFGVTADALRDENDLARNASLRPNQKIRLPEGYRDRGALVATTRVPVTQGASSSADETAQDVQEAPSEAPRAPQLRPGPSASASSFRTVTTRSVTGKVVEVEGPPATYEVKKGDNLEKIAKKLGTTVDQLREGNDLGKHKAIQPGQTLKGPVTTAHAYVAGQGDTLYSIAKRFGVTADALRDENDLARNASLRTGQKIRLPDGYSDRGPLTTTTRVPVAAAPQPTYSAPAPQAAPPRPPLSPSPYAAGPAPAPRPYTPPPRAYVPPPQSAAPAPYTPSPYTTPAPYTTPSPYTPPKAYTPPPRAYVPPAGSTAGGPMTSAAPSDAQISELGRGRFVWPLQGTIISDFGPKAPGQRNDGINIGAQLGASIRAAAAGDVVYAGDQVPGFGNLVLIKHANGWVTAYGHLSRVIVKMQQKVVQGQEIGQAGATGGVAEPQLHFEVRYASTPLERAKPVDPKLVLPK